MSSSGAKGSPALKWGIMGCGNISNGFIHSLRKCAQPNVVHAVAASNSAERARAFVADLQVPKRETPIRAYGTYEQLLSDPDIEIIYVGNLNETHCQWVCAALDHGKHVLCEKPMALSLAEAETIVKKAHQTGLFVMEGFWSRFFPVWRMLRTILDNKQFGAMKMIGADFGLALPPSRFRLDLSECPAADIGVYTVMFAMFCCGDRMPSAIRAQAVKNAAGVDVCGQMFLEFDGDVKASLMYNAEVVCPNAAFVAFENGIVQIPDWFYCPTRIRIIKGKSHGEDMQTEEHHFPLADDPQMYVFPNTSGLRYEADHVYECIRKGLKESPVMPLCSSINISAVMEEIRHQIGIVFPAQDGCAPAK